MTDASLPAGRFTQGNFRVGDVFSRAWSVFSRNFFKFGLVTGAGALPLFLLPQPTIGPAGILDFNMPLFFTAMALVMVLNLLSQAIVFHGAFQDMRRRPVSLTEGFKVSLGRFFPLLGLGLVIFLVLLGVGILTGVLFFVPGVKYLTPLIVIPIVMLLLAWSMGTPVCVVERAGPLSSLGRSRELTKGCRWKMFGLLLLAIIPGLIVSAIVGAALGTIHLLGPTSSLMSATTQVLGLIWNALWAAFFAVVIVVTYHNLRVAKEGIDTDQIAAVFE